MQKSSSNEEDCWPALPTADDTVMQQQPDYNFDDDDDDEIITPASTPHQVLSSTRIPTQRDQKVLSRSLPNSLNLGFSRLDCIFCHSRAHRFSHF